MDKIKGSVDPQVRAEHLRLAIEKVNELTDEYWQETLTDRKRKELYFHDQHRDRAQGLENNPDLDQDTYEKFYGNKKYYSATAASTKYVSDWIQREAKNKIFLDYACGNGGLAIKAAKSGASLAVGIDISPISVENAKTDAEEASVSNNTLFVQSDAENTMLPDNSVDTIICSGMLHHLDLSFAFPELRRILRPGGKILAVEALDYNPAIKLYRMMTPSMRTEWEKAHILSLKDVGFAKRFFDIGEIKYWHITAILSPHLPMLSGMFETIDRLIEKLPVLKLLAWIFTFELIKREE